MISDITDLNVFLANRKMDVNIEEVTMEKKNQKRGQTIILKGL
jgi:hypothetical protein